MSSVNIPINSYVLPPLITSNNINNIETSSIDSTNSEVQLSENQIQEYQEILNLLADENVIAYGYILKETIRLTEDLVGRHITNEIVTDFVSKAAIHLANRQWVHYGNSTARLELHLRAMSSVLHIFSQLVADESGAAIEANIRESLYKSVSKFWSTYRISKVINANITFSLREIRTCLRKIKDDQSSVNNFLGTTSNIFDVILNVINKEYWAAFGSFVKVLNFEYAAGEWYYNWQMTRADFFKIRREYLECDLESEKSERITLYYKHLYGLSTEEFKTVKRKNTKFRNFEYKMLKSGGSMTGCSLPDHVDTLLIGYLDLIQRMLTEFFLHMKIHIQEIIGFCNEIYESDVKKQLTFKAVEVLYVTRKISKEEGVKNTIKVDFKHFKSRRSTLDSLNSNSTKSPRSLSSISLFSLSLRKPHNIPFSFTKTSSNPTTLSSYSDFNRESILQITPPATPDSEHTSFSSHDERKPKSRFNSVRNTIILNAKFREISTRVSTNFQQIRRRQTVSLRNRIVDNVTKLMKERITIIKAVQEIKEINKKIKEKHEHNKSLQGDTFDKDELLNEFKRILEEREKDSNLNILQKSSKAGRSSNSSRESLISVKTRYPTVITEIPKYITIHNTYYVNNDNRTNIEDNRIFKTPQLQDKSEKRIENDKNNNKVDTSCLQNLQNDNISPEEKKEIEKDENSSIKIINDEVDNDLPEVEEVLRYQNDLDNEITLTSSNHIANEENEPVEIINRIINYQRYDEENHHITLNEGVECCYMQHMDGAELEEILSHQKYLEDDHILYNEQLSDNAVVNGDVQDLILPTETLKDNETLKEDLYLDNFEFPITDLPIIITTSEEQIINDPCYDQSPPPYEELSSSKSKIVNFDEFKKFLLNHKQVESSNPLWNMDNLKEFEDMYSKTFDDSNVQVQYLNFVNHVQYDQIKSHGISYDPPPPYEELSSSKSKFVNFEVFKTFLLNHHQVDQSNPLWNIDNVKDFEEMYSKTFNNSNTKDQYITFINNVQQNIVINIIKQQNPTENESSFFKMFKNIILEVENLMVNFSEGHKAAKRKSLTNLNEQNLQN
ncbi:6099_t:CDS:2 [Funneliformis geosporum]|uniref:14499_t:CDS:1 n=1 Tax=Funneliformis geosporum TaxID=1117311 RepID=A0A9W4WY14_9GLOM|nr:14499_t:CDS:2 [Funneliformis geosporum]CAI2184312.1 6099_t:CDS:2 [Funneliformis geosporum]